MPCFLRPNGYAKNVRRKSQEGRSRSGNPGEGRDCVDSLSILAGTNSLKPSPGIRVLLDYGNTEISYTQLASGPLGALTKVTKGQRRPKGADATSRTFVGQPGIVGRARRHVRADEPGDRRLLKAFPADRPIQRRVYERCRASRGAVSEWKRPYVDDPWPDRWPEGTGSMEVR